MLVCLGWAACAVGEHTTCGVAKNKVVSAAALFTCWTAAAVAVVVVVVAVGVGWKLLSGGGGG